MDQASLPSLLDRKPEANCYICTVPLVRRDPNAPVRPGPPMCEDCINLGPDAQRVAPFDGIAFRCSDCWGSGTLEGHRHVARFVRKRDKIPAGAPVVSRLTFATGCPYCRKRGGPPTKDPPIDLTAFEPYRRVVDLERAIWKTAPANLPTISTGLVRPGLRRVAGVEFKRPERETFHEYLFAFLKEQLPPDWWEAQLKLPLCDRHQLAHWYDGIPRMKANPSGARRSHPGGVSSDTPTGDVQCLLATAWDVFCLFQANCLPKALMKRLVQPAEFQGARYEVAVGATFVRAGCSIEWVKDVEGQTRPEFVATHSATGARVAVEAKSRQRAGVLGRPGRRDPVKEGRGDFWHLLEDARAKDVKDLPFIIFIDMNAAPEPGVPLDERSWWKDYQEVAEALPMPTPEQPDKVNAMFVTNFAYHYAGADATPGGMQRPGISLYAIHEFPPSAMADISLAAADYGHPPVE